MNGELKMTSAAYRLTDDDIYPVRPAQSVSMASGSINQSTPQITRVNIAGHPYDYHGAVLPPKLIRLINDINRFAGLSAGWDSYSAKTLDVTLIKDFIDVAKTAALCEGETQVFLTPDGTLKFNHIRGSIELDVETAGTGLFSYQLYDDTNGSELNSEVPMQISEINHLIRNLCK
jgi:hypothetical protein